ncbi:MAG: ribosome biogenesis factor YjgA [Pseudomonadota bacterium]
MNEYDHDEDRDSDDAFDPTDLGPSRSQRKRDHKALQATVRDLVALPRPLIDSLPVAAPLREALDAAKRLVPKALNREVRHLARQLADVDPDALRAVLARHRAPHREGVQALHRAERLRDRLLANDADAVGELFARHPEIDRQQVRQWVRSAAQEAAVDAPPKSARKLFKLIHSLELARSHGGDDAS